MAAAKAKGKAAAGRPARARSPKAPAATRPYWSGQIRLALVALPVKVYPATRSSGTRPALHQIHAPSGRRIRYEKVVPGIGPVDRDAIVMGYEYEKGSYVLLEPGDLDAIRIESKKTIDLVQFVRASEIPPIYYERPYYVVPDGELAEDGFVVIREALKRTGMVGLGQMALRGGESIVAVKPCGRGLLLETLRFADEIREADPLFAGIDEDEPDADLVALAEELIGRKTGPFDAAAFQDNYGRAFRELIEAKLAARDARRVSADADGKPPAKGATIVNLMDALKASVVARRGEKPAPAGAGGATDGAAGGERKAPRRKAA
jgi:DNA end-binding protein Ku